MSSTSNVEEKDGPSGASKSELNVVETITVSDDIYFGSALKDKIFNLKKSVHKPIKLTYSSKDIILKTVTIAGDDKEAVDAVKTKITSLLATFGKPIQNQIQKPTRQELTHFVSVPLNYPVIQDSFMIFKRKAQLLCQELEESLYQNPQKIHVTVGVMSLSREQEVEAKELLKSVQSEVINKIVGEGQQIKIDLVGVDILGDDPSRTRVVFAKVHSVHLQQVVDSIYKLFTDKKLMQLNQYKDQPSDSVKLHVTLMYTSFRTRAFEASKRTHGHGGKKWPPKTFDSTKIIKEFKDFDFVKDLILKQVHISCFKTKAEDGFYQALEKLDI